MWEMSKIGALFGGLGGMTGAAGSLMGGFAERDAANMNAWMEENDAELARQAGEDRAKQILRTGDLVHGTIRNRASASGLVADTGSPLLIQEESLYNSAMDAAKARYAGKVAAFGARHRATMQRLAGRQAKAAGFMNASASLLSGAASIAKGMGTASDEKPDEKRSDKGASKVEWSYVG